MFTTLSRRLAPAALALTAAFLSTPALAQHGVVREYAALDPAPGARPLPPLFDEPLTDISLALGPDQAFYLTGTPVVANTSQASSQITLWRSADMKKWDKLRTLDFGPEKFRAPEIHCLAGTFYLTLSRDTGGTQLVRFSGPDLAKSDYKKAAITDRGQDASLFRDDDGAFYWLTGPGTIARMKPDPLEGLAAEPRPPELTIAGPAARRESTLENPHGAFLLKRDGKYLLFVTARIKQRGFGRTGLPDGAEDVFVAAAEKPLGPFSPCYLAFPHAGQTTLFTDRAGDLWATYSGTDERAILRYRPAAFKVRAVPATEPRWPIGFAGLEQPSRFPFGLMLRPDQAFLYEAGGAARAKPIPMDPVPGQKAEVPWIRDTCIMLGHDGNYYMTGTSGNMDSLSVWKSPDLKRFTFLATAWTPDKDPARWYNKKSSRLLWPPELHYIHNTYWIPWCASGTGNSLLKSTTGRPEGPYVPAFKTDRPVDEHIDASLFEDTDGSVYYVWQDGLLRKLNKAMDDFDGPEHKLLTADGQHVGYEGVFLRKIGPWYLLTAAEWCGGSNRGDGTYDMMYAVSKNLLGPYSARRVAVPHAGHGMLFQDKAGRWCAALFGNDRTAPFRALPGFVPLSITDTGTDLLVKPADE